MAVRVLDPVPEEGSEDRLSGVAPPARVLGLRLSAMRASVNMLGRDVVAAGAISSTSMLSRYETGSRDVKPDLATVLGLAELYGHGDKESLCTLTRLVDDTNQRRWWTDYSDVVDASLHQLMIVESAANEIRTYSGSLVPGLLQTPEYARAVMQVPYTGKPDHPAIKRRWEVRRRRQEILEPPDAPDYSAVIAESVLRAWVGGRKVMRGQLRHLFNLAENSDRVHIRVFTDRAWENVCPLTVAMTVFKFPAPGDPDLVYREGMNSGGAWLSEAADVDLHAASMLELIQHSLGKEDTLILLDQLIRGFADPPRS
ncbi:helix-turn-helix transcriptional regulator [Streptomyces sp. NPDC048361]|uniref:helix-turn-helix domain-containing protein n=1 Tax=Streptomyces sp. NPDC048361 TaxID=3154720 RepID=UPI00342467A4